MLTYKVYRNLNNGLISIMEKRSRLVVGHCESVTLENVKFEVNQKGRQRVIDQGKKNVHAFVSGIVSGVQGFKAYKGRKLQLGYDTVGGTPAKDVFYNPFKVDQFTQRESNAPIFESLKATIDSKGNMKAY